jgi:hypothetical protein
MTSAYQPPPTPSFMTTLPYSQTIVTGGTPTGTTTGPYGSTITGIGGSSTGSMTGTRSGSATETGTKTSNGGHPSSTRSSASGEPSSGSGSGGGDGSRTSASHTLALSLGIVFGTLGLLAALAILAFCLRRRRARAHHFHLIGGSPLDADGAGDLDESPHAVGGAAAVRSVARGSPLPASNSWRGTLERVAAALGLSTLLGLGVGARRARERRDMLANEDTREFEYYAGDGWYYDESGERVRRQGSSSTTSSGRRIPLQRPTFGGIMQGSLASLRSVGAMLAGGTASTRRQGSGSAKSALWREKDSAGMLYEYDPFSDEEALMGASSGRGGAPSLSLSEKMPLPLGAAKPQRPRAGRQVTQSSTWSYNDPFADPADRDDEADLAEYLDEPYDSMAREEKPAIRAVMPGGMMPGGVSVEVLSPVSERPSVDTLSSGAYSRSLSQSDAHASGSNPSSSAELGYLSRMSHESPHMSHLSHDSSRSPPARPTSIIDANPSPASPARVRRSGSWWTRFASVSGSVLDRRRSNSVASDNGPARPALEFRDPNPVPRLIPIKESSGSQHSPQSSHHRRSIPSPISQNPAYGHALHGRSATSLQTSRTADSDAIERMGGMDVVKRDSSHFTSPSTASSVESARELWHLPARPTLSVVESGDGSREGGSGTDTATIDSPAEMTADEHERSSRDSEHESPPGPSFSVQRNSPRGSGVAERVRAYERRMSLEQESASPPPADMRSTRQKEIRSPKRTSKSGGLYGLAPRPSLYVANPNPNPSSDNLT